jgi:hypothetical protein
MGKIALSIILLIISSSCQKSTSSTSVAPLSVHGYSDFGNVLIGDQKNTLIILDNRDGSQPAQALVKMSEPYYLLSLSPSNCSVLEVPAETECSYSIGFAPSISGQFQAEVAFRGLTAKLVGIGVNPGRLSVSPQNFDLGIIKSGSVTDVTINLKNVGESDLLYPILGEISVISGISTTCSSRLQPQEECSLVLRVNPIYTNSSFTEKISLTTGQQASFISFTAVVIPGASSGSISFDQSPSLPSLTVATPSSTPVTLTVTSSQLKDSNGNIIDDGTPVNVVTYNLALVEDVDSQKSAVLYTKNGTITFHVRAGDQVGTGNFTAQSGASYGSVSIPITK